MDKENLNPINGDQTKKLDIPVDDLTETSPVSNNESQLVDDFFKDFSLPEDVMPSQEDDTKEPILKEHWESPSDVAEPAPEEDFFDEEAEEDTVPVDPDKRPAPDKNRGLWGMLHSIPHLLVSCIWLALVVIIGVSLGRIVWDSCADLMAFGKEDKTITITITEEEAKRAPNGTLIKVDIEAIAQKLADAGMIDNPDLFVQFATLTHKDQDIAAGTYTLNSYYDYNAIINSISYNASGRSVVTVMIPEGYTCAQVFALLEEKGVCEAKELEKYAAEGELEDYWFLEGVTRGDKYCLEGYLFPDTYEFYQKEDAGRVINKLLATFDYRFSDLMKEDFKEMQDRYAKMMASNGYGSDYITQHPLTIHQLVTLASIVEKESGEAAESFDIASVFYNRLSNQKTYPYLDADATVHYAIGDYYGEIKVLTQAHLNTNSPYNTRGVQKGLPPGPIANPGIYSLYAVLDPNETNYYYYVLDPSVATHRFATTYNEFLQIKKELGYNS
ncbi:MAG: endolytic transglycosylase MltG [Oscillospiraceae bacterium]|nr:endolytic transglycosylase MltG [Oscillospiraceae bacterium]